MAVPFGAKGVILAALMAAISAPASADDTTRVAVAAALGIEAADGKTTVAGGAGAIEAGLLATEGFRQAGAMIASMTNRQVGGPDRPRGFARPDHQPSDGAGSKRPHPAGFRATIQGDTLHASQTDDGSEIWSFVPRATTPMASDIAGAIATSTSIAPNALTVDDRLLLNSIMIDRTNTA